MPTPTPPAPGSPAPRPQLGSPPRRPPPTIPAPDPRAIATQRRFAFGLVVLSAASLMLSLTMRAREGAKGPALPSVPLPLPDAVPEPIPPWDDARLDSAAGATSRAAEACVARHAQKLRPLAGELSLIVHLPPEGPIDARLEGAPLASAAPDPEAARCLGAAAAVEPWPRPIGDRQVRLALTVVGPLRRGD